MAKSAEDLSWEWWAENMPAGGGHGRASLERVIAAAQAEARADLARAVLLFHGAGPWTEESAREWFDLTGTSEATTRNLCDFARRALTAGPGSGR